MSSPTKVKVSDGFMMKEKEVLFILDDANYYDKISRKCASLSDSYLDRALEALVAFTISILFLSITSDSVFILLLILFSGVSCFIIILISSFSMRAKIEGNTVYLFCEDEIIVARWKMITKENHYELDGRIKYEDIFED